METYVHILEILAVITVTAGTAVVVKIAIDFLRGKTDGH